MSDAMNRRQFVRGAVVAGAAAAVAPGSALGAPRRGRSAADLVVYNGSVLPMTAQASAAEAVAVKNGRIVAIGSTKRMRTLIDRRTQTFDAKGGTVLPGINDTHLHLNGYGLNFPPYSLQVDTATIDELVATVRGAVEKTAPGAWIRGRDWNDNRLPRAPTAKDLDGVSPNNPVALTDFSFHAIVVNSVVLRLAGITRDTVPPAGGIIEKDENGEPTGVFRETARELVSGVIPPFTAEQVSGALDVAVSMLHELGITSVTDPGIPLSALNLYASKHRAGKLPLRVTALLAAGNTMAGMREILGAYRPLRGLDPLALRVAGVKIYADGVPTAAKTAWLRAPYLDGSNGQLVIPGANVQEQMAQLHQMIDYAHRAGMQIGTHATGDATIVAVVDGYLKAMRRRRGKGNLRHYVIHGDLTPPETLKAMAKADIGVNMNATIKYLLGRTLDPVLGHERTDYQWPYRTALDLGVRVTSASDAPVTFPSWLQGVQSAMRREGRFGGVAGKEQRIKLMEALHTYTSASAWQDSAERDKGRLTPGRVGDLVVLGGDLRKVDSKDYVDVPIDGTVFAGKVVHDRLGRAGRTGAKAAAAAAALSRGRDDHGVRCYQGGQCCCQITDRLVAGHV